MRDWDKTIDELRKNIEDARKRWVLPYLDPTQFDPKTSENKSKVMLKKKIILLMFLKLKNQKLKILKWFLLMK